MVEASCLQCIRPAVAAGRYGKMHRHSATQTRQLRGCLLRKEGAAGLKDGAVWRKDGEPNMKLAETIAGIEK